MGSAGHGDQPRAPAVPSAPSPMLLPSAPSPTSANAIGRSRSLTGSSSASLVPTPVFPASRSPLPAFPRQSSTSAAVSPCRNLRPSLPAARGGSGGARGEDASADVSREFPNGDSYYGHWGAAWDVPHGTGCYVWADGSVYEGEWARGEKHGQGLFVWPSGARYKGEWARGQMQGVGSYWGVDGSFYTGNWAAGVKHGLGRKLYPNGDYYEGFWSFGAAQGPGRYVWANGNEYFGEWEGGMMSGCGTFTWASGESYEGEWEGGVEHGVGAFRWRDGSRYEGTWSHGLKDGKGVDGGIAASAINGHSHDAYDALTATVAAPVAVILSDVCGVEKAAASQILPGSFSMPKQAPDLISGSFNAGSVGSASARLVRRQTSGSVVGGAAAAGGGGGGVRGVQRMLQKRLTEGTRALEVALGPTESVYLAADAVPAMPRPDPSPHGRPTGESRRGGRDEGRRETNLKGGDGAGNLEEREERMAIVSERRLEGHGRSAGMAGEGIKAAAGASKGRAVREADMWRPLIGSDAESSQWGASSSAAVVVDGREAGGCEGGEKELGGRQVGGVGKVKRGRWANGADGGSHSDKDEESNSDGHGDSDSDGDGDGDNACREAANGSMHAGSHHPPVYPRSQSSSTPSSVRPWGRPPLIPDRSPLAAHNPHHAAPPCAHLPSDRSHALPDRSLPVPGHPLSHFRKPSDDFFVGLSSANGSSTRGSPGSGKAMRKCMSGPLQPRVMQEREGRRRRGRGLKADGGALLGEGRGEGPEDEGDGDGRVDAVSRPVTASHVSEVDMEGHQDNWKVWREEAPVGWRHHLGLRAFPAAPPAALPAAPPDPPPAPNASSVPPAASSVSAAASSAAPAAAAAPAAPAAVAAAGGGEGAQSPWGITRALTMGPVPGRRQRYAEGEEEGEEYGVQERGGENGDLEEERGEELEGDECGEEERVAGREGVRGGEGAACELHSAAPMPAHPLSPSAHMRSHALGQEQEQGHARAGRPVGHGRGRGYSVGHFPVLEAVRDAAMVREYVQGVLVNQEPLTTHVNLPRWHVPRGREGKRAGELIYKGHRSYDLMRTLQLGLRHSVGRITPDALRDVQQADFSDSSAVRFPPAGSPTTPPHSMHAFKWRDYCPNAFRALRAMFGIDPGDYMLSLCGDDALRELSSPGKSGSVFFLSQDDRFIIKTMRHAEVQVLLRMLPAYYQHVRRHPHTLLTKFFGLHAIKLYHTASSHTAALVAAKAGGRETVIRFVVMANLFVSPLRMHRRFDLKGSSQGRSTDKVAVDETTTLKDLDLDLAFHLHEDWRPLLSQQIASDCAFLERQRIMDYSLLLGVHFKATSPPPAPIVTIADAQLDDPRSASLRHDAPNPTITPSGKEQGPADPSLEEDGQRKARDGEEGGVERDGPGEVGEAQQAQPPGTDTTASRRLNAPPPLHQVRCSHSQSYLYSPSEGRHLFQLSPPWVSPPWLRQRLFRPWQRILSDSPSPLQRSLGEGAQVGSTSSHTSPSHVSPSHSSPSHSSPSHASPSHFSPSHAGASAAATTANAGVAALPGAARHFFPRSFTTSSDSSSPLHFLAPSLPHSNSITTDGSSIEEVSGEASSCEVGEVEGRAGGGEEKLGQGDEGGSSDSHNKNSNSKSGSCISSNSRCSTHDSKGSSSNARRHPTPPRIPPLARPPPHSPASYPPPASTTLPRSSSPSPSASPPTTATSRNARGAEKARQGRDGEHGGTSQAAEASMGGESRAAAVVGAATAGGWTGERGAESAAGGGAAGGGGEGGGSGEGGRGARGGERGGRKGRGVVGQLLGQGMAATAVRVDRRTRRAIEDPLLGEAYEVVLYFGIIDILQEYDVTKKVEHLYKSLQYDGHSISAVNPSLYARRFRSFIYATFPDPLTPHKPAPNAPDDDADGNGTDDGDGAGGDGAADGDDGSDGGDDDDFLLPSPPGGVRTSCSILRLSHF
ncbi:hypothetical protein CLOM_g22421 [Closterium sp. NIES-68]|nr:hypothetical protein CLOM_g22421 [Closterium sp. NIES-68]